MAARLVLPNLRHALRPLVHLRTAEAAPLVLPEKVAGVWLQRVADTADAAGDRARVVAESTRQREERESQSIQVLRWEVAAQLGAQLRVVEGEVAGQVAAETPSLLLQVDGGADDGEVGVRGEFGGRERGRQVQERRRGAGERRGMQRGVNGNRGGVLGRRLGRCLGRRLGRCLGRRLGRNFSRATLDGGSVERVTVENVVDLFAFYVGLEVRRRGREYHLAVVVIH